MFQRTKVLSVRHFDLKALRGPKWQPRDFHQLARVLVEVFTALAKKGETPNPLEVFSAARATLQESDGKLSPLLGEVEKALLSLSDFTGQMTPDDTRAAVFSALIQGIHPALEEALVSEIATRLTSGPAVPVMTKKKLIRDYLRSGTLPRALLSLELLTKKNTSFFEINRRATRHTNQR